MLAAAGFNKTDDDNSPFFTEKINIPYVEPNSTTEGESYKISFTERELTFFKHTGELLSSRMIFPDIKSRLEKKKL